MRRLEIILSLVKRNKFLNLLCVIELAISTIFVVLMVNSFYQANFYVNNISDFPYKAIVYNRCNVYGKTISANEAMKYISEMYGYVGYSNYLVNNQGTDGDNTFDIIMSDEISAQLFKSNLLSGKWYSEYDGPYEPCVIVNTEKSTYKVGDIITIETDGYRNKENTEYIITGVMNSYEMVAIFSSQSEVNYNYVDSNMKSFYWTQYPDGAILCNNKYGKGSMPVMSVLYFDKNVSDQKIEEYAKVLKAHGGSQILRLDHSNGGTVYDAAKEVMKNSVAQFLPYYLVFFMMVVLCLITISIINAQLLIKRFSIYWLLGMVKKQLVSIYLAYIALVNVLSASTAVIVLGYYNSVYERVGDFTYKIAGVSTTGIVVSFFVFDLILLLPFVLMLKAVEPIDLLTSE